MPAAEKETEISLTNFYTLLKQNKSISSEVEHRLRQWISEFEKGNFSHIEMFVNEMHELLDNLENVKEYVEHEQSKQLSALRQFMAHLTQYHVMDHLRFQRDEIKGIYDDVVDDIISDLRQEAINEGRVIKSQPPFGLIKDLKSHYSLDRDVAKNAVKEAKLSGKLEDAIHELLGSARALSLGSKEVAREQQYFIQALKDLAKLVVEEFDVLLEQQVAIELQENDLIKKLQELALAHPIMREKFTTLHKFVLSRMKEDILAARRIKREAELLKKQYLQTL